VANRKGFWQSGWEGAGENDQERKALPNHKGTSAAVSESGDWFATVEIDRAIPRPRPVSDILIAWRIWLAFFFRACMRPWL
jgi:hypothetical protein